MQVKDYNLSHKQISSMESYARYVLGEDHYKLVGRFYDSIVQSRAQYRVVLTRKCFNLLNVYYWCRKKDNPDDSTAFSSLFYSDNTLISSIPQIAAYYVLFNRVPDILIIDDILIHGRTINSLIDDFIDRLTEYLRYCKVNKDRDEVERDVLRFLTIKVMVQNNKPLLMKGQYVRRIELLDGTGSVWDAVKWHDLSFRTSRLISENIFSNTAYVLSMYEIDIELISRRAVEMDFTESAWKKRGTRNVWVKPLYRPDGSIAALYTIRLNQNSIDNQFTAVPFIMMADFNVDFAQELFDSVGAVMPDKPEKTLGLSKLIPLMLSYNLLLLFLQDYSGDVKIDRDKIFSGAGNGSQIRGAYASMLEQTKPFLTMEQLNALILRATAGSAPLSHISRHGGRQADEVIACEGENLEKEAYLQYSGQKQISGNAPRNPVRELLDILDTSTIEKLADSVGDILRLTDTGSLALSSYDRKHFVSCTYRAGEQSQFIHPKKYMEQIPVLCEMERDCMGVREDILERVRNMYSKDKALCSALCGYINTLYDSGQHLSSWDINYFSWTETDFEKYPELKKRSRNDRIELQMILNSIQRIDAIKRYRKLYPKQ